MDPMTEFLHVRSVIGNIKYGKLKCLPKNKFFTKIKIGGDFAKEARTIGYSNFGCKMEHVLRHAVTYRQKNASEILLSLSITPDKLDRWEVLIQHYRDHFPSIPQFDQEWIVDPIQGHPDFVMSDTIYEMKTAYRFGSMRSAAILQVLAYYCLAKKKSLPITKVALIIPNQNYIEVVDLSGWNWECYWSVLVEETHKLTKKEMPSFIDQTMALVAIQSYVGYTIRKENLFESIEKTYRPLQFFLAGRTNTDIPKTLNRDRLRDSLSLRENKRSVFIHSPYTFNLSNISKDEEKDEESWVVIKMRRFMEFGEYVGVGGVVVHCGKCAKLSKEKAIENMIYSVVNIAPYATPDCPLLVETSAGQNGELFSDPHELACFYMSLPEEIKVNVKICFDSCHVFAAGHKPSNFLKVMDNFKIPIHLIHYNDSKCPLGGCVDRHASPLTGHLGIEEMLYVLQYAIDRNIPCVYE